MEIDINENIGSEIDFKYDMKLINLIPVDLQEGMNLMYETKCSPLTLADKWKLMKNKVYKS